MIRLVAFLGNYGGKYERTRHNAAWLFADSLPVFAGVNWRAQFEGEYCVIETPRLAELFARTGTLTAKDGDAIEVSDKAADKIYFLKPQTYMNNSGQSIIALANYFKIKAEETLIVHDELELPAGTLSLKWSGGLGGHNGLRSAKAVFATADFWRLRFGIGRPADGADIAAYVLSPFGQDDKALLDRAFSKAAVLFAKLLLSPDPAKLLPEWKKVSV
ncbi:MAG: aminoacyl-tRNA hydrolase [Treponema sp.]